MPLETSHSSVPEAFWAPEQAAYPAVLTQTGFYVLPIQLSQHTQTKPESEEGIRQINEGRPTPNRYKQNHISNIVNKALSIWRARVSYNYMTRMLKEEF